MTSHGRAWLTAQCPGEGSSRPPARTPATVPAGTNEQPNGSAPQQHTRPPPTRRLPRERPGLPRTPASRAVILRTRTDWTERAIPVQAGTCAGPAGELTTQRHVFNLRTQGESRPEPADVGDDNRGSCPALRDRLPGCDPDRFGMGPAVLPGQDLSEVAAPVGDGARADLAAHDRQLRNGHREAAGR
jgi:hypothetical protein